MAEEQNEMFENTVKRTSRAETTREQSVRRKPWAPPSMLDAPPAPMVLSIVGSERKPVDTMIQKISVQKCERVGN